MALTKCTTNTSVIAGLGTTPQERGLTTEQFKAKFDEAATGIKDYINNTLTEEIDALLSTATEESAGIVELATAAETTAGTDSTKAVHPAGLKVELDKKLNIAGGTMTGNLTVKGIAIALAPLTATSCGLEIGSTAGAATSFIDFHSGAIATDYDARIIAEGGDGTIGKGTLKIDSASLQITKYLVLGTYYLWVDATGKLRIKNGVPASDTDGTVVGTQS